MPHERDQLRDFARRYTEAWCSQQPTRVAAHFADCARGGGQDWAAAGHCLERRKTEAFEQRWIDHHRRGTIPQRQFGIRHKAGGANVRREAGHYAATEVAAGRAL